jgi:hypothetical protein
MTRILAASTALALSLLAGAAFADSSAPYAGRNGLRSHHVYATLHAPRRARPVAPEGAGTVPHRVYEREGLTRNPADCVVYGCIGNN